VVKVTHSTERPIQTTDWHKRLCAQVMLLLAAVGFASLLAVRYELDVLFPMTRSAAFLLIVVTFFVARRYLAPRLDISASKAAMFGLGAATITFLYFAGLYSIVETGSRISAGYIDSMAESIDSMAEIATRVLTDTFDLVDYCAAMGLALIAGFFAEILQRLWGPPIRAPRV